MFKRVRNLRDDRGSELIPLSSVVRLEEISGAVELSRFDRLRAITISAGLSPDYSMGEAIEFFRKVVDEELPEEHMQEFADFILSVRYPPNPIRSLDDVPTPAQAAGETIFFNAQTDGVNRCETCHTVDLTQGFFGGDGFSSVEGEPQEFKIPHLRNQYQKVGMFGVPPGVGGGGESGRPPS